MARSLKRMVFLNTLQMSRGNFNKKKPRKLLKRQEHH
jgi:hypothetical protein